MTGGTPTWKKPSTRWSRPTTYGTGSVKKRRWRTKVTRKL